MKLRVIFLKKKHLFFIVPLVICTLIILFVVYKTCFQITSPSFSNILEDKILKADFDGDGIDDKLYVKQSSNKYMIKVKIKNKAYDLITNDNLSIISSYYPYWPLRITILDVSRNRIPEIFIQGSLGKNSVQRIFTFNGKNFENILSNSNNILGFIDCTNNRTPKIITGKFQQNTMSLTNYIFLNYKFKNYNLQDNNTFMGKDTISSFIDFIQKLPASKSYIPNNIFSSNLTNEDLYSIDKLANANNSYIFQDAIFTEKKCDNKGNTSELSWILNFKGISNSNNSIVKNYTVKLVLAPDSSNSKSNYFKIVSIY
ncbi:VCBS repeat-containing protein [Clostridium sp. LBM24168]